MRTVAQFISIVLHPFVTIAVVVIITGWRQGSFSGAVAEVAVVGTIAILPVAVLIFYKVRTREWMTVDASRRTERSTLYPVSLAAALGLILFLRMKQIDSGLLRGAECTCGLLLFAWIVNRWVKISLHMAFASLVTTVLTAGGFLVGWLMLVLLPGLTWSRLKLKRHTVGELAFGVVVGTITGLAIHLAVAQ